jgi:hypothetical protein
VVGAAAGERRAIDPGRSSVTVHAFKEGFLSAFAHDHTLRAPVASGWVDRSPGATGVEVHFETRALEVLDPELSASKRASVRETMLGPTVLDRERYPEIVFRSTSVVPHGDERFSVEGELALHGKTRTVRLDVSVKGDRFHGSVPILQSDFGITPVRIAGGTIRVRDELRVDLDIALVAP